MQELRQYKQRHAYPRTDDPAVEMEKYNKQVSIDGAAFTVARINETDYANIYGVKDSTGRIVGTVEERLAGRDVGTYFTAWAAGYGKRDIRKAFTAYRKSWA